MERGQPRADIQPYKDLKIKLLYDMQGKFKTFKHLTIPLSAYCPEDAQGNNIPN